MTLSWVAPALSCGAMWYPRSTLTRSRVVASIPDRHSVRSCSNLCLNATSRSPDSARTLAFSNLLRLEGGIVLGAEPRRCRRDFIQDKLAAEEASVPRRRLTGSPTAAADKMDAILSA